MTDGYTWFIMCVCVYLCDILPICFAQIQGLYDMPRPFTKLKALSIEDVAADVSKKLGEQ